MQRHVQVADEPQQRQPLITALADSLQLV